MKRLNLKLLIGLLATAIVVAGAAYGIWAFQMQRNSKNFLIWADEAKAKGNLQEEADFLRRYLRYYPKDEKILSRYALLVAEPARDPARTSPTQIGMAIGACTNALRENDKDSEVRYALADLYMRIGRGADAIIHLERLRNEDPKNSKALKMLAQCQQALGNHDKAEELFREAIINDPKDVDLYGGLAEAFQRREDYEGALKCMDDMVAANPDNWLAYLRRYQFRVQSGIRFPERFKLEDARPDLAEALRLGPTELQVLLTAADRATGDRDFDKGREYLDEARKHHPDDIRVYTVREQLERYANRPEEAAKALEDGLKVHPDSVDLLWRLIDYRLREGKMAEARGIIRRLGDLGLPADRLDFARALVLIQERKYSDAVLILNRIRPSLAGVPLFGERIEISLAMCYRALNQADKEMEIWRRMLLAEPLNREARLGLARALIVSGQVNEAIAELEALVEAGDPNAERMMFQALLGRNMALPPQQRNWTRTDELINKIVTREPDNIGLFALHVDYLNKKGHFDEAQKLLDDNREKFGKEAIYWLSHADLANAQKGPDAGLAMVQQAEQQLGPKPEFLLARASLLAQKGDDASKRQLMELTDQAANLSETERRAVLSTVGQALYVLRDFPAAEQVYRKLVEMSPDDLNLQLVIYSLMRDADDSAGMAKALAEIQRIAGENNSYTQFCRAAAIVNDVQRQKRDVAALDEARKLVEKAAAQRPNWGAIYRLRGEIEQRQGNTDKAIEDFRHAVELGDTNPGMIRQLAALLLSRDKADELTAIIDKIPNGRALLGTKVEAVYMLARGEVADAIPIAQKAAEEDPNSYVTQLWLGDVLRTGGRFNEAEAAYKRASELAPDVADAWLALVRLYVAQDRTFDAQDVIQQIEAKVKPEQRQLALASAREIVKSPDAEREYLAALEKNPNDLRTLELVAAYYFRVGNAEKVVEYLNRISELGKKASPEDLVYVQRAHRTLAELYANNGRPEDLIEAIKILDRNANPNLPVEDKSKKAMYYARLGDPTSREAAIDLLKSVLQEQPERALDRVLLAELYDRSGDWRTAKDLMLELTSTPKYREDPLVALKYADMLLRHGEVAEAIPLVDRIDEKDQFDRDPLFIAVKAHLLKEQRKADESIALIQSQIIRPLAPNGVPLLKQAGDQLVLLSKDSPDAEKYLAAAEQFYREYVREVPEQGLVLANFLGNYRSLDAAFEASAQALKEKAPIEQVARLGMSLLRAKSDQVNEKLINQEDAWLKQALTEQPDSIGLKLLLADLRDLQGNFDDAVKIYRELKDNPELAGIARVTVLNNLAFILAVRDKRGTEALPLIEEAITIIGPASELLDTRGMVRLSQGDTRGALIDLENSLASGPSPVKHFHLALAHLKNNNRTAAADYFDRARDAGLTADTAPVLERDQFELLQREFPTRTSASNN
jgi:tetratricopeptide (TPR) repeat protein